jgi:ribonuclease-3
MRQRLTNVSSKKVLKLLDDDILNSDVFQKAVTHRSVGKKNNERLEFLGDSVLGLVITDYLFKQLPTTKEGELSRLRSHLVRGTTLAEIAAESNLGDYLKLGEGELKSGGFRRESIMEDALEAIIGAVYTIKGFDYVREYILALFSKRLANLPDPETLKDPKSRLQEWLQSKGKPVPVYRVLDITGDAHQQEFLTECRIESLDIITHAQGASRRKAEQSAAEKALAQVLKK